MAMKRGVILLVWALGACDVVCGADSFGSSTGVTLSDRSLLRCTLSFAEQEVVSSEDLSDRLTAGYPGPQPFPGPEELVLTADPAPTGNVSLTLAPRDGGQPRTYTAAGGREMRFLTELPFGTPYVFKGVSPGCRTAIRAMIGRFRPTAAEAVRLEADTGNPLHVSRGETDEPVVIVLRNAAGSPVAWKGTVRLRDYWNKGFDMPVDASVDAGGVLRLPVGRQLAKGIWRVTARVQGSDGSEARHGTSFAVLDRHGVTPKAPFGNFRLGVNYHMAWVNEKDLGLTLAAVTAMGAKIVRVDSMVNLRTVCANGPGTFCWDLPDRLVGLLEGRGIAIDAIVYGIPKWARTTDPATSRSPHRTPGFKEALEGFCRAAATRYGTRLDYYEVGNEWDLVSPGVMTVDEAVDLQKAAWRGVKAGCAQARVMTCGWALESSDHPLVTSKGFQENVMERAKGYYDVHPVHVHGRFPYYETRMRESFFAFRRARGIDAPWYANETALSSAQGAEDLAAEAVFKKILWSQAFGSTDYIWYNLRATGWVPSDGEQGYGLITADYHPRAGYAVFSALAAVFGGLAADGVMVSERGRFVFRFKGNRDGVRRFAFAGWDDNLRGRHDIHVRTDAARAFATDLMGNAAELPVTDGVVTFAIGRVPGGLVLVGATAAEPVMSDVRKFPPLRTDKVVVPISDPAGRGPDFELTTSGQVEELWKANPATEFRTWKGPQDLSAEVRLAWKPDRLCVRVDVTDDKDVYGTSRLSSGDAVHLRFVSEGKGREVWLARDEQGRSLACDGDGSPLDVAKVSISRAGLRTHYSVELPWKTLGFADTKEFDFNVRVLEDDGDGRDGWMSPRDPERTDRLSHVIFQELRQW